MEQLCAILLVPASRAKRRQSTCYLGGDTHGELLGSVPIVEDARRRAGCLHALPGHVELKICGLVRWEPSVYYEGPLTQFSAEEETLWQWFRRRTDVFSVLSTSSVLLNPGVPLSETYGGTHARQNCGVFKLPVATAAEVLNAVPADAPAVLQRMVMEHRETELLCMPVPEPIAEPLVRGHWTNWMLCRGVVMSQPRVFEDWPPLHFWSKKRQPSGVVSMELPPSAELGHQLRGVANTLRQLSCEGKIDIDMAASQVALLDSIVARHSQTTSVPVPEARKKPLEMLIDAVLMSKLLRTHDSLREVMQKAVSILCTDDDFLKDMLIKKLEKGTRCKAGKQTIRRARFAVDVAFTVWSRQLWMPRGDIPDQNNNSSGSQPALNVQNRPCSPLVYMFADASPQGGREWLLSYCHMLTASSVSQMCSLLKAVHRLAGAPEKEWMWVLKEQQTHKAGEEDHDSDSHSSQDDLVAKLPAGPASHIADIQATSALRSDDGDMSWDLEEEVPTSTLPASQVETVGCLACRVLTSLYCSSVTFLVS